MAELLIQDGFEPYVADREGFAHAREGVRKDERKKARKELREQSGEQPAEPSAERPRAH